MKYLYKEKIISKYYNNKVGIKHILQSFQFYCEQIIFFINIKPNPNIKIDHFNNKTYHYCQHYIPHIILVKTLPNCYEWRCQPGRAFYMEKAEEGDAKTTLIPLWTMTSSLGFFYHQITSELPRFVMLANPQLFTGVPEHVQAVFDKFSQRKQLISHPCSLALGTPNAA